MLWKKWSFPRKGHNGFILELLLSGSFETIFFQSCLLGLLLPKGDEVLFKCYQLSSVASITHSKSASFACKSGRVLLGEVSFILHSCVYAISF